MNDAITINARMGQLANCLFFGNHLMIVWKIGFGWYGLSFLPDLLLFVPWQTAFSWYFYTFEH
jgi:hypothetical protein